LGKGELTPAERALIEFLRSQAPQPSGLLAPLLGPRPQAEAEAPVFGRRRSAVG
jgi:hypothetical protein